MNEKPLSVGKSFAKSDAGQLVSGSAKFTDDVFLPNMLHGRILSSPHAHARLKFIDATKARALAGVHGVITWKDVPRVAHTTAGQIWPEPSPYDTYLLDSKVRFVGDRVAAVAAETPEIAERAIELIKVQYEILPAVFHPLKAMMEGAPIIHDEATSRGIYDLEHNVAARILKKRGNIERGFAESDLVVEQEYCTQRVQHCSLEPHVAITWLDTAGRLLIRTSTQVPFHIRRQVAMILQLPIRNVCVIQPNIGGGFGGKQELVVEDICAALTLETKRPVRVSYSRRQEFIMARTRHSQILRLKIGVKRNGLIRAIQLRVTADTGAYGSHAVTVQGNTGSKVLSMYRVPHLLYEARVAYTNTPIAGAFRGYGCTQGFFALESHLDEIAHKLRLDPIELRRRNVVRVGDIDYLTFAGELGQKGRRRCIRTCGITECLDKAARGIGWARLMKLKPKSTMTFRRGVGLACSMQGSGISGISWSSALIKANEDGSFVLTVGISDPGTGSLTMVAQIAAETLGVSLENIMVQSSDTDSKMFDLGAYASSTTVIAGGAVKKAAEAVRRQLLQAAAAMLKIRLIGLRCSNDRIWTKGGNLCTNVADVARWSIYVQKRQICASASHSSTDSPPPFCAQFADVEVDTETGKVYVHKLVTAVDVGFAINPAFVEGQIDGAVAQGLGFALSEELLLDRAGRVVNPGFHDYKIFTAMDMPQMKTFLITTNEPLGPFGAKAVAEVAINGVAPCIANAIFNATGVRVRRLPISPQKMLNCLKANMMKCPGLVK
jgi:putative selenate reductase molybdopterin-binding subunit